MLNLQVAGHVRHQVEDHGGVLVLDTAAGCWLALNPTAGEFWRSWDGGADFEEAVAYVAAGHPDVPQALVRADAERLLDELFSLGLIEAVPLTAGRLAGTGMAEQAQSAGAGLGWPRVCVATIFLLVAALLVMCSFRLSYLLVRATRRKWCRQPTTPSQARATVIAVSRAARHYPGRAACLEQSLAAVLLAAASRRRLDWCLGSATDPYRFHAWVEVAGQAVSATAPGEQGSQSGYSSQAGYRRVLMA
jgi:hypothetical protein